MERKVVYTGTFYRASEQIMLTELYVAYIYLMSDYFIEFKVI